MRRILGHFVSFICLRKERGSPSPRAVNDATQLRTSRMPMCFGCSESRLGAMRCTATAAGRPTFELRRRGTVSRGNGEGLIFWIHQVSCRQNGQILRLTQRKRHRPMQTPALSINIACKTQPRFVTMDLTSFQKMACSQARSQARVFSHFMASLSKKVLSP